MRSFIRHAVLAATLALSGLAGAHPGQLDCSFGTGGKVVRQLGAPEAAQDIARQSTGRLLTLGGTDPWNSSADTVLRLTRFLPDGAPDASFGTGGSRTHILPGQPLWLHLAVDSQDRILAAGRAAPYDTTQSDVLVARFLADGSVDTSFGTGGSLRFSWSAATTGAGTDGVTGLAVDAADRVIVVGTADPNGPVFNPSNADAAVARLTAQGQLDVSFGNAGIRLFGSPGTQHDDDARSVAVDALGRIVVVGMTYFPNTFNSGPRNTLVARLLDDGMLDPVFDGDGAGNGVLLLDISRTSGDDFGWDITVDPNNRVLTMSSVGDDPALARLLEDGRFDTSFSGDGVVQRSFFGGQDVLGRVLVQADGKPIVTGWPVADGGRFRFASMRFGTDGEIDLSWGTAGVSSWTMRTIDRAYAALLQPDGKLVIAGGLDNDTWFGMARVLTASNQGVSSSTQILSVLPLPSGVGEAVSVSYSVTATQGGTPAGTVTVSDGVDSCSASVAAGQCSLLLNTPGLRSLTARFAGSGCHQASESSPATGDVRFRVTPVAGIGGTLSPATAVLVAPGTSTSFQVLPETGYRIASVSGCGGSLQGATYQTGPAQAACTVTATFELKQYTLRYLADSNGTLQGPTQQLVTHGTDGAPVTAVGNPGWRFAQWSDGQPANPRTDTRVMADLEVTAQFAPFASALAGTLTVLEDSSGSGQLDGEAPTPRSYVISTPPLRGTLSNVDPVTGTYTYLPAADFNGSDSFAFTVSGAGATSAPATVQISVTPVNDAPQITLGTLDPHPAGSSGVREVEHFAQFDAGPPDEDTTQTPQWLIPSIDDPLAILVPGSVAIAPNGSLTYQLAGRGGAAVVTVSARDGGGTANGGVDLAPPVSFTIQVVPGADLQVAKSNFRNGVVNGQAVVYRIVVAHGGPDPVVGARVLDPLPATLVNAVWQCVAAESTTACPVPASGTGDLDVQVDLPVGSHLSFDLAATVSATQGSVVNTAQVLLPAGMTALDPFNDQATDTDPLVPDGLFANGFEAAGTDITVPAAKRSWQRAGE